MLGCWPFLVAMRPASQPPLRMHFERKDVIIQQGEPGNMSGARLLLPNLQRGMKESICTSAHVHAEIDRKIDSTDVLGKSTPSGYSRNT